MRTARVLLGVLFLQVVCVTWCQSVFAQSIILTSPPRFVGSNILELRIHMEGNLSYVGYYDVANESLRHLLVGNRDSLHEYDDSASELPCYIWRRSDALFSVAEDGSVSVHKFVHDDNEDPKRHVTAMAFPQQGLYLQRDRPWYGRYRFVPYAYKYLLIDKETGTAANVAHKSYAYAVSPSFGKDRNYFLVGGSSFDSRSIASVFSIKPFAKVCTIELPAYRICNYVYEAGSGDLILAAGTQTYRKQRFLRVRHDPEKQDATEMFKVDEFATANEFEEATWRNGLIYGTTGTGIAIKQSDPEKDSKQILIPYLDQTRSPNPVYFAVNDDGTLVCVSNSVCSNKSYIFQLWRVDFPNVTSIGKYIIDWDKDSKVPNILREQPFGCD